MNGTSRFFIFSFVVALISFGILYNHYGSKNEIPILKADNNPKRIKPENIDNEILDDSDNLYDTMKNQSEVIKYAKLIPEPEAPINITSLKNDSQEDVIDNIISGIVESENISSNNIEPPSNENNTTSLKIVTIPDTKQTKSHNEKNILSSTKKAYYLQIASARTKIQAENEWVRINRKYSKILNGIGHKVIKYDFGKNGIIYQLFGGPMKNGDHAKLICKKLINSKQNCIIKRL